MLRLPGHLQATYIGETDRNLNTTLTEHRRAKRNGDINNNIAERHLQTTHTIDWDVYIRSLTHCYALVPIPGE